MCEKPGWAMAPPAPPPPPLPTPMIIIDKNLTKAEVRMLRLRPRKRNVRGNQKYEVSFLKKENFTLLIQTMNELQDF